MAERNIGARITPEQRAVAKAKLLELRLSGLSVAACAEQAGFRPRTIELWKQQDPQFREDWQNAGIAVRKHGKNAAAVTAAFEASRPKLTFAQFREKYLGMRTFPHQQNMIDVVEGRPPSWLPEGIVYQSVSKKHILINLPPEHCAVLGTPVLSDRGWVTVGDVRKGDQLVGKDGRWWPVFDTWRPDAAVPVFDVRFNTGDVVTTDGGHKWIVHDYQGRVVQLTTADLFACKGMVNGSQHWRIPVLPALDDGPDMDLPLDPWLLGFWLGDGDMNGYRLTVGDEDADWCAARLTERGWRFRVTRDSGGRCNVFYVYGMTKGLRELGLIRNKRIPDVYFLGSKGQRLELLRGLLDSDGTISAKDGRARWVQHGRDDLVRDVYRLVATLGYQPRMRRYGPAWEVCFRPGDDVSVFGLPRKANKQKPYGRFTMTEFRTVESVTEAGTAEVQCITMDAPDQQFAIGDAMIPTVNAKSMTMSVDYPTFLIANNPNIRILIVSKTKDKAKEFVYAVKNRLTHPRYQSMQLAYGPADGWGKTAEKWAADSIYLGLESRDSAEKDPTLQALGIGGQIYGARADIIILDDCVVLSNSGEYEKQIRWIQQEVLTRLGPGGRLVILGTRVDVKDLYSEIVDDERYPAGKSPWTLLRMPAVLEFHDDPKKWVTLWPRSDHPWGDTDDEPDGDGLYPRWSGPYLNARRGLLDAKTWSMVYMQAQVDEAAVFPSAVVRACVHQFRQPGLLKAGVSGHPENTGSMEVVCGLDPAMTGDTAAIAYAVDRRTRHRWVLDCAKITSPTPAAIRNLIFDWSEKYKPSTWVVEKNAFQLFLTQDEGIREFLSSRGIVLREHYTSGVGKWDADYGVASMAPLFGQLDNNKQPMRDGLIHLPSTANSEACKALVEQLITWAPATKNKTDLVMALWFAEIKAREIVNAADKYSGTHLKNRWLTPRQRSMRATVNIDEWLWQQQQLEEQYGQSQGRFVAS